MFQRPCESYNLEFDQLDPQKILEDDASPIGNIISRIPDGSKVLDIGAGNGILGWMFGRLKPGVMIDGVEPSEHGASVAKRFYRNFYCSFFQDVKSQIVKADYDYIVMADVIEHVNDPLTFLQELIKDLSEKTRIILSIPNVAHYSVRLDLLNGNFSYVDSGLLERTHVRFFTLATIEEMVRRLRINVEALFHLQRACGNLSQNRYRLGLRSGYRLFGDLQALTYQYLFVLTSKPVSTEVIYRDKVSRFMFLTQWMNRNHPLIRFALKIKQLLFSRR